MAAQTSTQLTDRINKQASPMVAMFKLWLKTRYLVAQKPAAADNSETSPGYFNGRYVIPGPLANLKLSAKLGIPHLTINDFQTMMNQYYIRFVDNKTTEGADMSVRAALYTIMSEDEADSYETKLKIYYKKAREERRAS